MFQKKQQVIEINQEEGLVPVKKEKKSKKK